MKEKLHAGKRGGRGGRRGEDWRTHKQAGGWAFLVYFGVSGHNTQNSIRDLTQSFLSSVLEQSIRVRESPTTVQASYRVIPNNSMGQVFKAILPRNYAHKSTSLTAVLAHRGKLVRFLSEICPPQGSGGTCVVWWRLCWTTQAGVVQRFKMTDPHLRFLELWQDPI